MNYLDGLQSFAQWVFVNSLKASILIALIFMIQWFVRDRLPAKWQHALWLILIVRLLLPAGFESNLSLYNILNKSDRAREISTRVFTHPMPVVAEAPSFDPALVEKPTRQYALVDLLASLWMVGVLSFTLITLIGNLKCWMKIRHRQTVMDSRLLSHFSECQKRMNVRRPVQLAQLESIQIPMLYGWLRPVILLPSSQTGKWTPDQINHILCHELAHCKRHDILIAHITTLLQILHWFNPLMWLAFYKIRLDREIACDAIALNHLGREQSRSYGSTILSLLENISNESLLPMTVGIVESKKNLKRRLTSIAKFKKPRLIWTIIGLILALIIGCAALTESRKPENKKQVFLLEDFYRASDTTEKSINSEQEGKIVIHSLVNFRTKVNQPIFLQGNFTAPINPERNTIDSYNADSLTITPYPIPNNSKQFLRISGRNVQLKELEKGRWQFEADKLTVDTVLAGQTPVQFSGEKGQFNVSNGTMNIKADSLMMSGILLSHETKKSLRIAGNNVIIQKVNNNLMISLADGKIEYNGFNGPGIITSDSVMMSGSLLFHDTKKSLKIVGKKIVIQEKDNHISIHLILADGSNLNIGSVEDSPEPQRFGQKSIQRDFVERRDKTYKPILMTFQQDGKWGYKDSTGQVVIAPQFEVAWYFTGRIEPVKKDGKWGIIDKKGNWIVEPTFEEMGLFNEGLAEIKRDGKWGFVNEQGHVVIPPQFELAYLFSEGLANVQKNGKFGFIDQKGRLVIDYKYDRATMFFNGLAPVEMNGAWGFIDRQGKQVIPCTYERAGNFSEGLAVVRKNGRYGYINPKNEFVIKPQFDEADDFSEGLATVKMPNQKYGFIDKTGKLVISAKYDAVSTFDFGRAHVIIFENPQKGIKGQGLWIDRTGKEIGSMGSENKTSGALNPDKTQSDKPDLSRQLIPFQQDGKWGYRYRDGQVVIQPIFQRADGFGQIEGNVFQNFDGRQEIASVKLNDKFGCINPAGEFVIKPAFDAVLAFSEGLATTKLDGKWGAVDSKGKTVIPFKYDRMEPFMNGLAGVMLHGKMGFIDKSGKVVIPIQYDRVGHFMEELASVQIDGKVGYLNTNGKLVIPAVFDESYYFSEGLAETRKDGLWGYIDRQGQWAIFPRYGDTDAFSKGLAAVKIGNKYGFIDQKGKVVIEPKFDYAGPSLGTDDIGGALIFENPEKGIPAQNFRIDKDRNVIESHRQEKKTSSASNPDRVSNPVRDTAGRIRNAIPSMPQDTSKEKINAYTVNAHRWYNLYIMCAPDSILLNGKGVTLENLKDDFRKVKALITQPDTAHQYFGGAPSTIGIDITCPLRIIYQVQDSLMVKGDKYLVEPGYPPDMTYAEYRKAIKNPQAYIESEKKRDTHFNAPTPIGGWQRIMDNVVYPEKAKEAGLEGRVYFLVFADEKGEIEKVVIDRSSFKDDASSLGCHQAAIDAVKSVEWRPAWKNGKPQRNIVGGHIDFILYKRTDEIIETKQKGVQYFLYHWEDFPRDSYGYTFKHIIITNSDEIFLDGKKLRRNQDYTLSPLFQFTLSRDLDIKPTSIIEFRFQYWPKENVNMECWEFMYKVDKTKMSDLFNKNSYTSWLKNFQQKKQNEIGLNIGSVYTTSPEKIIVWSPSMKGIDENMVTEIPQKYHGEILVKKLEETKTFQHYIP